MLAIKMSISVLLIVTINLFTLQQCLCLRVHLDGDESNLRSQLVDTDCKDISECNQFLGSEVKRVECVNQKCVCSDADNKTTTCVPKDQKISNEIGMECPCLIKYSECNKDNKCQCQSNFTVSDDNKHCVPVISQLNQYCEINLNCQRAEPYSICQLTNMCGCHEGFKMENNTCFSHLEKIDKECSSHTFCSNITSNSLCASSNCVCKRGFVASRNEIKCLPILRFGESCEDVLQCQYNLGAGGKCVNGKCGCGNGYKKSHPHAANEGSVVCVRQIAFGIECTYPMECILENEDPHKSSMVCSNNTCICRNGFTLDGNICKEIDAVGAATQNGINSYYFVLLFATIFISSIY